VTARLVVAVCAFAVTLAFALGTFVVLPVNGLVGDELARQAAARAEAAAVALRAGAIAVPGAEVVAAPSPDGAALGVTVADWSRRDDAGYVRRADDGQRAFAVRAVGDGRLVAVRVDRGGAIERRERLGLVLSLVLVLTAFLGWALWTGGAHARRLAALARVARRIADGDFTARASVRGRDEVALLGRDVDRMADRLAALERARGEFVAKVSHDLRTPLTIIKGYAYTLERRAACAEDAVRLAAIGRESDRLAALVDDLLTLSQAGAGALRVTPAPFPVHELLDEVAERVAELAAGRGVELAVDAPPDAVMVGDRRRLAQVLTNLTTNATRHTPPGGTVALGAAVAEDGSVELTVTDDGVGIDEDELPRLLRPFEHAGPAGGTGLGLAIAGELVHAHGGTLALARRPGGGTVARASIPASRPALLEP
jgi:two-component system sensor histidine kinase BaeS